MKKHGGGWGCTDRGEVEVGARHHLKITKKRKSSKETQRSSWKVGRKLQRGAFQKPGKEF